MSAPGGPHLDGALSALLDGELSAQEEPAVRAHLAACEACTAALDGFRSVRARVRALPPAQPPSGFLERLAGPTHLSRRRRRRSPTGSGHRWVGLAALAATAAASVAVLLSSAPADAPVSPQMARLVEAHATSSSGDPISQLAPVGVPVTFRR